MPARSSGSRCLLLSFSKTANRWATRARAGARAPQLCGLGLAVKSHSVPCQLEMRPSAPQAGQVHTTAWSMARAAVTVPFLHLKHFGAAGPSTDPSDTCATTSTRNCANVRAGPLTGASAPEASRKCVRSVMCIGSSQVPLSLASRSRRPLRPLWRIGIVGSKSAFKRVKGPSVVRRKAPPTVLHPSVPLLAVAVGALAHRPVAALFAGLPPRRG